MFYKEWLQSIGKLLSILAIMAGAITFITFVNNWLNLSRPEQFTLWTAACLALLILAGMDELGKKLGNKIDGIGSKIDVLPEKIAYSLAKILKLSTQEPGNSSIPEPPDLGKPDNDYVPKSPHPKKPGDEEPKPSGKGAIVGQCLVVLLG